MHSAPTWDPQQYLRHADHRTRPFQDLLARIPEPSARSPRIADLGCGPGNVTTILADRWPTAHITGFDNSAPMLADARAYAGRTLRGGLLDFRHADLGHWTPDERYDLIVSNAALQWVPGHAASFPAWTGALTPGGILAFQVPGNADAPSHTILRELCGSKRWSTRLGEAGRRRVAVLEPADYLERLARPGHEVDVWETTYLHLLTGEDPVLDWVKGTALRPVLTALDGDPAATEEFLTTYRGRLREAYPTGPHGTVFPFRRIFAVARKGE
ncbi:trans-aconitate 2-methyltransferase [Streptomyces syringium]|uniref:trans-aconitate 2-methyltransferase n=1 Tax=Streptomyces syringium TaxID=76729 RepID=UPI003454EF72